MLKTVAVNERGYRIGEDHPNARYTNCEIDLVFQLRDEGFGYKRIAKMAEIPVRTVRGILKGERRCQCSAGFRRVPVSDDDGG